MQSCAYVLQGMCAPLVGTTLVHMERLFDSDTATMSWTFTVSSLGYFLGAVACGFVFDHINRELQLLIACCTEAATTIIAPFFTVLPLFIAALFIQAFSRGFIDASKVRFLSKSVLNIGLYGTSANIYGICAFVKLLYRTANVISTYQYMGV